jgi:hypothetical protein
MAAKLLLCISADQATIAVWRNRRLNNCKRFQNDADGLSAFSQYLRATGNLPVHIIVDTVDEDYRFETLPRVRGSDRKQMVGRKLKQLYRNTPYCSYSLQERASGKRGDDRYLFAAITNTEVLSPWLRAIGANRLPVAGIYPLPGVTISLIERLRLNQGNLLIVNKNSAGLRQTFFKTLRFRISRLTPLRNASNFAEQQYADEVGNTRMYLDALTVTHVDDALTVLILDQDDSLAGLPGAIARGRSNMQCQLLNSNDVVTRLGVSASDLKESDDALHLHLLGSQKNPILNLAPPREMRGFQRYLVKRLLYGSSAAALAIAALWSGLNVYQAMKLRDEIVNVQRRTSDFQAQYRKVTAEFPPTPTSADDLRNTVMAAEQIRASLRTPEQLLLVISHALDSSPEVQLKRLDWRYGSPQEDLGKIAGGAGGTASSASASGALRQFGVIGAEIKPFDGDFRAALDVINAFAAQIAAHDSVAEVKALRLPLDVRSDAGMSGSTTATAGKGSAQFELAVIFKPGA